MRLVDADAFDKRIRAAVGMTEEELTDDFKDGIATILEMLKSEPTIEPERKKGKWIDNHTTCSECGWQMVDDVTESPNMVGFNFCPNCGADMREGEQDGQT